MRQAIIIVAAGKGVRMQSDQPKQFLELNGRPILLHTIENLRKYSATMQIIVVLPKEYLELFNKQYSPLLHQWQISTTTGGATRFESVKRGLSCIDSDIQWVGVHDGVRPFISTDLLDRLFQTATDQNSAIPVVPLVDSLRLVDDNGHQGVDRSHYRAVQTPQVFAREWIEQGYQSPFSPLYTDDACVVESSGYLLTLVEGAIENIKITTPFDLAVAQTWLAQTKP